MDIRVSLPEYFVLANYPCHVCRYAHSDLVTLRLRVSTFIGMATSVSGAPSNQKVGNGLVRTKVLIRIHSEMKMCYKGGEMGGEGGVQQRCQETRFSCRVHARERKPKKKKKGGESSILTP